MVALRSRRRGAGVRSSAWRGILVTDFIDLDRRFHPLTNKELGDAELLASFGDSDFDFNKSWKDLLKCPRVVLLAEAGAGKTVEMTRAAQRLAEEGKHAFFLPLESLDRDEVRVVFTPDENERFDSWMAHPDAPAWFFLDSVDELKLGRGTLDGALRRLSSVIQKRRLHRARFVISCRLTDWRRSGDGSTVRKRLPLPKKTRTVRSLSSDEAFMAPLTGDRLTTNSVADDSEDAADRNLPRVFAMLPLSDGRIRRFAERIGRLDDSSAFLAEVERRNAWSFARRPQDLEWLVRSWRTSARLATWERLHHENIVAKLADSSDRPDAGVLTAKRAMQGAERLALALTLVRTGVIQSPDRALDMGRADGALDPAKILDDWTPEERQALLRRALFDPATYGRVRFHHRTVREYLAARQLEHLHDNGMTTRELFRRLFANKHGFDVVLPSMREIAAWLALRDSAVRNKLIKREPETLLSHGDPESLDVDARRRLLRTFATRYGKGGHRGLDIPIESVRRIADPDLAPTIRECWALGRANDEVRALLIETIQQGRIKECADLTKAVAKDEAEREFHRVIAIRALAACRRDIDLREIADDLMNRPQAWPDRVVHGAAPQLYPNILATGRLIALMKRTPEPPNTVGGGFQWAAREIAETVQLDSKDATELRDELTQLIRCGCKCKEDGDEFFKKFNYLTPALAILCQRQLSDVSPDLDPGPDLIESCVTAWRFGGNNSDPHIHSAPARELRSSFQESSRLRELAFWAEVNFVSRATPGSSRWHHHNASYQGLIGSLQPADWGWLMKSLVANCHPDRRRTALHALLDIWQRGGRVESDLISIREKLDGDIDLCRILNERSEPPTEPRETEWDSESGAQEALHDGEEKERTRKWKEWRDELISSPDEHFAGDRRMQTVHIIFRWLLGSVKDSFSRNVWNRKELSKAFNSDIVARVEKALGEYWRATKPATWATRPESEKNTTPRGAVLGLMGVLAEAEKPKWVAALSPDEAERAAAYATLELNEFPSFLADLTESRPNPVEKAIGGEVSAQLGAGGRHDHLPELNKLARADNALKRLLAPRLLREITSWRSEVTEDEQSNWAEHLDQVLSILNESGDAVNRGDVARECADRYRDDSSGHLALSWLRGLARFDPVEATETLKATLVDPDDADSRERAVEIFGSLFESRDPVTFNLDPPEVRAGVFRDLTKLAHAFIRPEEDRHHEGEGFYTPDAREDARNARHNLLSRLYGIPGSETCRALISLAGEPEFSSDADYLKSQARRRAAADAEGPSHTEEEVIALCENHETPPADRDGAFDVMMDRLEDIEGELANGDFSDRELVQSAKREDLVQKTLAMRLQTRAKGLYRVTREEEVVEGKHPDIRLLFSGSNQKTVIEVKIAEKYSTRQLEDALHRQLAGYLRGTDCKAGCLLLVYLRERKFWLTPDEKRRLDFGGLTAFLQNKAADMEKSGDIRVGVFGLDLTGA